MITGRRGLKVDNVDKRGENCFTIELVKLFEVDGAM